MTVNYLFGKLIGVISSQEPLLGKSKMKKFLFLQILLLAIFLTSFALPSYGAGDFSRYYNKGIEFYKQGKYDQAGKEFEKAIELKPNDVYALYGLGNTYYCKSKYDDAVKVYSKAININPDYAKVHYSLSLAYSKLGMTREAEKQKSIFRKLSQGGEGSSQKHAKSTHTSTHSSADHVPKKTLSHTPKKTLHESTHVETHATHEEKTHTSHEPSGHEEKHVDTHTTHAPSKHEDTHTTHAPSKHEDTHTTHAPSKHVDSHSTHAPVNMKTHMAAVVILIPSLRVIQVKRMMPMIVFLKRSSIKHMRMEIIKIL